MNSRQNPVVHPYNGADFVGKETIRVDLNNSAKWKIREPACHFSVELKHENFIHESIVPNIVENFSKSKKQPLHVLLC